jgi:hypothetical protein
MTPQAQTGAMFGLGAAGSVISGIGAYESGQAQRSAYDYNADITLQNMRSQEAANAEQFGVLRGRQASAYAASGVDIASGSPLLVMAATQARGAEQGKMIEQQGTAEANMQRYYGKIAAFSGTMSGIGSFLSGITKASTSYYGAAAKPPSPSVGPSSSPAYKGLWF